MTCPRRHQRPPRRFKRAPGAPQEGPEGAKIAPILSENVHFYNIRLWGFHRVQDGPGGPQDRPKTAQEAHKRVPRRPKMRPRRPQRRPRRSNRAPRGAQEGELELRFRALHPKGIPETASRPSRSPKEAPRGPKEAPRGPKKAPKRPQNCLQEAPERLLTRSQPKHGGI